MKSKEALNRDALTDTNLLVVVAGPTAVGKTELCVHLARHLQCDIISADSRQFFHEMSVGTARPTKEEMQDITHHFVDFLSIEEDFSSGRFEVETLKLLPNLFSKRPVVIMAGGSGLYIQAVCSGMNEIPQVDSTFREELYRELKEHGLPPLLEELRIKDPDYFMQVDGRNPQRIIRALEVCRGTGQPYSVFRLDRKVKRNFNILKIGLNRDREELFERIDQRMDKMISEGLFDEAAALYEKRQLNALKTVGYKEVFDFMEDKYDKEEAIRLLKRNSRRYAKRQLTWFKKDPEYVWFHPEERNEIFRHIRNEMIRLGIGAEDF